MIDQDILKGLFEAVDLIRKYLPTAALVAELADPTATPVIEAGAVFLGTLFEQLSKLQSNAIPVPTDQQLQADTLNLWKTAAQVK